MRLNRLTDRGRVALFIVLVAVGLVYIAAFAWFKKNSVDFVDLARNQGAAAAAEVINSSNIDWTFEEGSPALSKLGLGWRAGAEGSWSRKGGGVVFLPSSIASDSEIEVQFDGHLNPPDTHVTVTLSVDGEPVRQWRLTRENLAVVDRIRLPAHSGSAAAWRMEFVIDRPGNLIWRGYEPGLLIYGIFLRRLRTVTDANDDQPPVS